MRKKFRKITAAVVVAVMLLSVGVVFAQDVQVESELVLISADLPDNDELFAGYVEKVFYGETASLYGTSARERLSEHEQKLYDFLKEKIESVARGELASTVFEVDTATLEEWGIKTTWTNTEIGVGSITDSFEVITRFWNQFEMSKILEALLHDCPYDLYWYDKEEGMNHGCRARSVVDGVICTEVTIDSLIFYFSVSENYQADGYKASSPAVNTDKTGATVTAVKNAQAIVADNAGLSDYEKLKAYNDEICNLVSYDYDAINMSYGDPWQIISVFDGDESTKVVCEGYAKAFQYLCDISDFREDIHCYAVGGTMGGGTGSGNHMWNIVTMEDGKNYLVDLTNSDTGTIGMYGGLFLGGAPGSINDTYLFRLDVGTLYYLYDAESKMLWGTDADSILNLAENNYVPSDTDWEYLAVSEKFKDTLIVRKSVDESGEAILSISARGNKELPELKLCTAVYEPDGALKNVVSTLYEGDNIKLIAPETGEGELYKLMLWADDQSPVIEAISK